MGELQFFLNLCKIVIAFSAKGKLPMKQNEYQYEEMVLELREAVRQRQLTMTSRIQIMRDKQIKYGGAYPILEWYYDREGMSAMASVVLDEAEGTGSFIVSIDSEDGLGQRLLDLAQYVEDMPYLEETTVAQALWEMEKALRS